MLLNRAYLRFLLIIGGLLPTVHSATAADLSGPVIREERPLATSPWTIIATPYAWLPFLQGDVTVRNRTVSVDVNPFQLLRDLDTVPWMSYVEARRGPLAFYNDIVFAKAGVSVGRSRFGNSVTLDATAGLDVELAIVEVGGAYEVARWAWPDTGGGSLKDGPSFARYTAFDVIAGARYWHQDVSLNLAITGTIDTTGLEVSGSRLVARSGSVDWVDPLIGFRVRHAIAPGQDFVFRADVGGFDAGSKFSWNVLGAYSWDMFVRDGITYSGVIGYRALSVDYQQGSGVRRYEYDVVQHGPVLGLALKF